MPSNVKHSRSIKGHEEVVETPRIQALIALARIVWSSLSEKPTLDSLLSWHSTLDADLQRIFKDTLPKNESEFDALLSLNCKRLPDLSEITDFLAQQILSEEDAHSAKVRGAVFTPSWLARRVTRSALRHWHRLHRSGKLPQTVADIACGPGAFLYSLHTEFPGEHRVIGADIHPMACTYAKTLSCALGVAWDIRCQDTLLTQPPVPSLFSMCNSDEIQSHYDLLIGNPPYVRSQLLPAVYADEIRSTCASANKGNFDLSVAFVEHAIEWLSDGGIASYILTNKFMTSAYGKDICSKLARRVCVLNIEDFQDNQVFPGYTTYTCVLTFSKMPPTKRFLVTRFPGILNGTREPGPGQTSSLPSERLATHPWDFATDRTHEALRLLREDQHPLIDTVFGQILQGLRTGANQVFVVDDEIANNLESEILIPFVNGESIRRGRISPSGLSLIYPYRQTEFGEVSIISEAEMSSNYPKIWDYLCERKSVLKERAFDNNTFWYAYSRSQNLRIGGLRKLLVREMMPRAEFAADFLGTVTFASGYALDASRLCDDDLNMWTAILCTPTLEFALRQNGTQLRSGWFRLLKHHLRRLRLPNLSTKDRDEARKVGRKFIDAPTDLQLLSRLDDVVAKAFGLKDIHREAILTLLKDEHLKSVSTRDITSNSEDKTCLNPHSEASRFMPVCLSQYDNLHRDRPDLRSAVTFVPNKTTPIHRWYKYNQGFAMDLVVALLHDLDVSKTDVVLDPFAGSGTTCLTCRQNGIPSIGIEISPLMVWVASTKVRRWNPKDLRQMLSAFSPPEPKNCRNLNYENSIFAKYLTKAYSIGILRQLWSIAEYIDSMNLSASLHSFLKLGMLSIMEDVSQIRKHGSHYRFMLRPESIGLQKLNTPIISPDSDIRYILISRLEEMIADTVANPMSTPLAMCKIQTADARSCDIESESVDVVITSPPYLNRNNYIAQQKAELAILSLVESTEQYHDLVDQTIRSHVEGQFKSGNAGSTFPEVQIIVDALSLTKNNNPKIPHMIAAYFDDLAATFRELWRIMRSGGRAAFVVGNSRWGGVVVPVDHLLLKLAEDIGFKPERVLVTRLKGNSPQQMRQYGRIPVRESIIVFTKP